MKKFLCLTLSAVLAVSLFAGCRRNEPENTDPSKDPTQNTTPDTDPTDAPTGGTVSGESEAVDLLSSIWDKFGDDEKFASYGGDVENAVDNAPGQLDLKNVEEITSKFMLPQEHIGKVKDAASLVHLMNSNIFTAALFRLENAADTEAVADAIFQRLQNQQWICGSPDRLLVAEVLPGRILMVYAGNDAMTMFREKMDAVFADAVILHDQAVAA